MRWRWGISLLTVLTAAVATGAAVLGPLYLQTAGDSVLRTTVASASTEDRGGTILASPGQVASLDRIERAERGAPRRWYGAPITSVLSGVTLVGARSGPVRSQLFSRTGICRVLRFADGTCNLAFGDVAISERSARELGVSLGTVIDASVKGMGRPLPLKITGIYAVPSFELPYWWGNAAGYFPFGQVSGAGQLRLPAIDALVASPATALAVPPQDVPDITGQLPLRLANVSLAQESPLRRAASNLTSAVGVRGLALSTQLPSLLAAADQQRHTMATIVAVAAVQLAILAIWVLAGLLLRSGDARQAEIRVARLRGFPMRSILAASVLEPATLCAVGLVLGAGAAWGAVAVARDQVLSQSASISPGVWVFAALGLSVAAVAGSLGIGTLRLLRSSGLSAAPVAARETSRRGAYITDAVLLVLSVVAIVSLATNGSLSGHSNPIAAAAPGLIALGTAVIAVQLVLFACRIGVSASANSGRVAIFLALRQIVRRPALIRQTRVLIIALCLACFAISAWSVARTNRATAATFGVGATQVATVAPRGIGLQPAVDRVDPHRRFAMAAVSVITPSSTLVGVDSSRLAAVMPWPRGISRSTLATTAHRLSPASAPPVSIPDSPLRLTADTAVIGPGSAPRNFELALWMFNPRVGTTIVDLGPLHAGRWTYEGGVAGGCPGGCRLSGLGLIPTPGLGMPSSGTARLTVTGLSARVARANWTPLGADLSPHGWVAAAGGVRVKSNGTASLTFAIPASAAAAYAGAAAFSTPPMASPADHPALLPGAVTSEIRSINGGLAGGPVPGQGLDGNTLNISPAVTVSALPRVGANAVMVDLGLLGRSQVGVTSPYAVDEVWLGPHAPSDALLRLRAAGLHIVMVQTASAAFGRLERAGPALADDFLLVATIVSLFAAAASTLATLGANTRQRATELTALEVAGVSRRVLTASLTLESAVLALTALFGAAAGVLAALMAIPSIPELATGSAVPLQYELPAGLVAAVSAAVVGVILLAAAAGAAVLTHRMSPLLLRMAPNDSVG